MRGTILSLVLMGVTPLAGEPTTDAAPSPMVRVTTESAFSGWAMELPGPNEPPERKEFAGKSRVSFRERALSSADNLLPRLLRVYDEVRYDRKQGETDEIAGLRDEARRVIVEPKQGDYIVYSPDVPLRWPEISMMDEHVHLPILTRFTAGHTLTAGESWDADEQAVRELTGVDVIESGGITCKVEGTLDIRGQSLIQVGASGTIVATTGPIRSRSQIRGGFYLSPDDHAFVSMRVVGVQQTLQEDDEVIGEVQVDYQVLVEPMPTDAELSDEVLTALPTEANDELLAVEFVSDELGISFRHSRRWILQRAEGSRLYFAGPNVSVVLTVEPPGQPLSGEDYLRQVREHFDQRKLKAELVTPFSESETSTGKAARFGFQATVKDRPSRLEYRSLVDSSGRGVTVAINASDTVEPRILDEVDAIVGSIRWTELKPTPADS